MIVSNNFNVSSTSTVTKQKASDSISGLPSSFVINDELTPADKSLIVAATGSLNPVSSSGTMQINDLALQIAFDRAGGFLTGEVDKSYINNLITQQKSIPSSNNGKNDIIPFSVLEKALSYLDQKSTASGKNVNTTA